MNRETIDPLLLLGSVILIAASLAWVIPSGQYKRSLDSHSGSTTVVPGSYQTVAAHPVGVGGLLLSIPRGVEDAAPIVFYVLFSGAALTVVELTSALGAVLGSMAKQSAKRPLLVLFLSPTHFFIEQSLIFSVGFPSIFLWHERAKRNAVMVAAGRCSHTRIL